MRDPNTNAPRNRRKSGEVEMTRDRPQLTMPSRDSIPNVVSKVHDSGSVKNLAGWLLDNQIGLCLSCVLLILMAHYGSAEAQAYTSKYFTLSYYNASTGKYGAGRDDFYFLAFCVMLLIGLRASCMKYVLAPLARLWGIPKKKDATRFAEQGWILVYYSVFWPLGVYIYYKSPYFLNLRGSWTDWPQRELDGLSKGYILVQSAVWTQQILAANLEDRRKDYWQIMTHHIVTIVLMYASYAYHQTRAGHLILMLMDVIELIFPLAKCLKYLGFTTICDVLFGLFVVVWLLTRHVFYLMICWTVYFDIPQLIESACFRGSANNLEGPLPIPPSGWSHLLEPFRDSEGTVCWNDNIMLGFLFYLLVLQAMMVMWSVFIVKVVIRVFKGDSAEDIRSDDEEAEAEDEDEKDDKGVKGTNEREPIEQEVGVEDLDFEGWQCRAGTKNGAASASGVRVPGHSDRKELLNRIGCEKQID